LLIHELKWQGVNMQPFFIDYLNNLQEFHDEIRTAIKGLPQEALDWTPEAEINSLNVLVTHLSGAERYWIGDVIAGEPSMRDREAEFRVQGLSEQDLIQRLRLNEDFIQKALERLALQELEEPRTSPRNGRSVTVGWALCHVLKHTALHLGHMQITRQLWEQRKI
jgi:uncharacterized damage-inducible protein DinB